MYSEHGSYIKTALAASLLTLLLSLAFCFFFPVLPGLLWEAVWSGSVLLPCLLLSLLAGLLVWLLLNLRSLRSRCDAMQLSIDQALRKIDALNTQLEQRGQERP